MYAVQNNQVICKIQQMRKHVKAGGSSRSHDQVHRVIHVDKGWKVKRSADISG